MLDIVLPPVTRRQSLGVVVTLRRLLIGDEVIAESVEDVHDLLTAFRVGGVRRPVHQLGVHLERHREQLVALLKLSLHRQGVERELSDSGSQGLHVHSVRR